MVQIKNSFFKVLDVTGAIAGGIIGILIVMMIWRAKKYGNRKPEYSIKENRILDIIFVLMFLGGIVYEIVKVWKFIGF